MNLLTRDGIRAEFGRRQATLIGIEVVEPAVVRVIVELRERSWDRDPEMRRVQLENLLNLHGAVGTIHTVVLRAAGDGPYRPVKGD